MERSRSFRLWLPATTLLALMAISAVAWRTVRTRGLDHPIKVLKVTAAAPCAGGEEARAPVSEPSAGNRRSLYDLARQVGSGAPQPALATPVPARRLDGAAFIAKVERTKTLSPNQRTRLQNTLELASTIQKGIDTTEDPLTQAELQRRLDDQVRTRLQMILPKETLAQVDDVDASKGLVAFESGARP